MVELPTSESASALQRLWSQTRRTAWNPREALTISTSRMPMTRTPEPLPRVQRKYSIPWTCRTKTVRAASPTLSAISGGSPRGLSRIPMTIKDFRRIALGLKDTIESAHMGHPDFRIDGRLFASLHKDQQWGMVALTPDQQQEFVIHGRETFVPENGAWGRMGYTKVHLASVDEDALGRALTLARQNAINKGAS